MEKITFTKKGKEYITLDNEGLFLAEEGISFSPTKTHMIPWKNITKIKLGSVGSRGVVDAQLDIYTNIKKNEVDKATKSATFGFDDFINETITYRLFITDIDDIS